MLRDHHVAGDPVLRGFRDRRAELALARDDRIETLLLRFQ